MPKEAIETNIKDIGHRVSKLASHVAALCLFTITFKLSQICARF